MKTMGKNGTLCFTMETPRDLELLLIFATVAEESSFSKAATKLGLAKGTVSRSIARLETILGAELLHRTTHRVAISTAGTALYERTTDHLKALRAAVNHLPETEAEPSGLLRIAAAADFGAIVLPAIVGAFSLRYPKVRFEFRLSGREADLVKEGFDLAIRVSAGPLKDSSLKMRKLGQVFAGLYASPAYLARRGKPKSLDDPAHHWIMHPGITRQLSLNPNRIRFFVDDFFMARELMRDGVGIGLLPAFVANSYVQEGVLEDIPIKGVNLLARDLFMLYPSSGQTPLKVRTFGDFLISSIRRKSGI